MSPGQRLREDWFPVLWPSLLSQPEATPDYKLDPRSVRLHHQHAR